MKNTDSRINEICDYILSQDHEREDFIKNCSENGSNILEECVKENHIFVKAYALLYGKEELIKEMIAEETTSLNDILDFARNVPGFDMSNLNCYIESHARDAIEDYISNFLSYETLELDSLFDGTSFKVIVRMGEFESLLDPQKVEKLESINGSYLVHNGHSNKVRGYLRESDNSDENHRKYTYSIEINQIDVNDHHSFYEQCTAEIINNIYQLK